MILTKHRYGVTSKDRASQFIAPAFDPVGLEVWPFLTAGASIHVAPEEARVDPGRLRRWLKAHRITVSLLPTPVAEVFVHTGARQFEQGKKSWPRTLRVLYTGGDKLKAPPRTPLPFRFDNHYGPSECTIIATFCQVRQPTSKDEKAVPPPIGGPCANVKLYVLDLQRRLVPIGAAGELWIGGHGLARGYLNRKQLSSERFVPLPPQLRSSLDRPDARMYRTGDLVRFIPGSNGKLDFLGRVDQQVKIRGMRIELGEIESTLASAEWVRECAVIAREDRPGEKRLVAYVVTQSGVFSQKRESESSKGEIQPLKMTDERRELVLELRSVLKQRLAEYMVPHTNCWVFLRALPLTPNGKVNKRALPAPPKSSTKEKTKGSSSSSNSSVRFVAPRTEDEELVGQMVCSILSLPAVSVHDNFFELGGHSLAATQLLAAIQETFGVDLPIGTLFANPTVASIVRQIHALRGDVVPGDEEGKNDNDNEGEDTKRNELEKIVDQDLHLMDGISFDNSTTASAGKKKLSVALLTGATGFVGAYVLHQLLVQPEESTRKLSNTIVVCIARGGSDKEARERVRKNLVKYDLWRDLTSLPITKLRVLAGDLALPKLGLQNNVYESLRKNITEIYHCAAWVHGLYPYNRLRQANVVGTAEILKLASMASPSAHVHHISTLSVVPESFGNVSERDELPRDSFSKLHQGYAQTKWVAEKLVEEAQRRGLRATVWRLGRITGHNVTGVASTEDFMCRFIKGCVQIRCAPELPWPVDMNPVNLVGAAIVRISRRGRFGNIFHYCHPNPPPLVALFKWLDRFGYQIHIVKYMKWRDALMNCKADNSLMPLRTYFEADENWGQGGAPKFDSTNLTSELSGTELWGTENVDAKLLGVYFKYYIKIGFMPERRGTSPFSSGGDDGNIEVSSTTKTMPQKIGSISVKRQWSADSTLSSQDSGELDETRRETTSDALFDMEF
jgi:thioester reductase-like protein